MSTLRRTVSDTELLQADKTRITRPWSQLDAMDTGIRDIWDAVDNVTHIVEYNQQCVDAIYQKVDLIFKMLRQQRGV